MICRKKTNTFIGMKVTPQKRNRLIGFKECLGSEGSHGTYQLGSYGPQLSAKKRDACRDLVRFRVSIPWRTALYDIANINILSGQSDGREYPGEQFTCLTHKRQATHVFFVARGFAY